MDHDVFLQRVQRWGGMTRRREIDLAISATLRALRDALSDDEAGALARELSPPLGHIMRSRAAAAGPIGAKEFYERAARYEGVSPRFAIEHAQAVCQALASVLPPLSIARVSRAAPELAPLFEVPDRDSHPATVASPNARNLAEGHPGSDHPLSEARPVRPDGSRSR
jgi:uncharacterized protein (DUF2267 family)